MGRTKNAIKNGAWSVFSRLISLLLPFVVRSVIIYKLGVEYLGLGSLFNSVLVILNMTELGVGSAIVYSMYKPVAEGDTDLICALMNLYKKMYRIIGCVILVLGLVLFPFIPFLIKGDVPSDINLHILYLIYLFNATISYWLFAYKVSILNACQRNDVVSKVNIVINSIMYGIQIILLFIVPDYYVYVIALPIFAIIKNIVTAKYATKIFPDYICKGTISEELSNDIKKRVQGLMMNRVAFASRNAFDSVIISAILGLHTVALYNNYYYIISAVSSILTAALAAVLSSIGNSIATESIEKNEEDMKNIYFIYMSFVGVCYCYFLSLYQPFMSLWVGENLRLSVNTMIAFSVYFIVEKSENIIGNYYDAAGIWWYGKWKGFIEAAVNLLLNITLCNLFGAFGVVIATLISMMFVGIPLTTYYMYKYYYKKSPIRYCFDHYLTLMTIIVIGFVSFSMGELIPEGEGYLGLIICMVIRIIIATIVYLLLYSVLFCKTKRFKKAQIWMSNHINTLRKA